MTSTFTKIAVSIAVVTIVFGVFSVTTNTHIISEASAQTSCGSCGGGGNTGDNDKSGNRDTPPPVAPTCNLTLDVTQVDNIGDAYRLEWVGTPSSASFFINGSPVPAVGHGNFTFTGPNYDRFRMTGNNQGLTCQDDIEVIRRVETAPTCDLFTATPSNLPVGGGDVTLRWETTSATNATIDGQRVAGSGTLVINNVTSNRTFTLNLSNAVGQASCTAPVTVTPPPDIPDPVCVINANPTSITAGGSSQLSWTSQNAVSASINQGIGAVAFNGNRSVNPGANTTYTMTVSNAAGVTATCTRTIIVTPAPSAPVCELFTANPTTISRGSTSTLNWNTKNATTVVINNGVGSVAVDGSITVTPLATTTYTLTATGNEGTVTCPVTINVTQPPVTPIFSCANNVRLSANPASIRRGDSSTITWTTTGVTSLSFNNGITKTILNGSETVSPTNATTYTMTISNGTQTDTCPVNVDVISSGGGGSGGGGRTPTPRCELTASAKSISAGGKVTLAWKSSNTTGLVLKDSFGKTLVSTDGKSNSERRKLYDSTTIVNPTKDTKYTLTVSRSGRNRVCTVEVDVKENVIVTEVRDQKPVVTGIALTQVPYTGFEAGPIMTLAFYTLLVLWALYLAYVLMIRRTPIFTSVATNTVMTQNPNLGQTTQPLAFVPTSATPDFHVPAVAPVVPENVQYGYSGGVVNDEAATEIENRAHEAHVLFSGEAMRHFMATTAETTRMSTLDAVLAEAKASYPTEDGWVVLNEERMQKLCTDCVATATPTAFTPSTVAVGNSSLAEAIVTGNIVAAYQLIGNRPMIALTDAVADLDALYRAKQGADVTVSKLLAHADVKSEQLHAAINALTGALDGTYTDEAEAVKMAIMKAVKALTN